jgi:hypothetical protein
MSAGEELKFVPVLQEAVTFFNVTYGSKARYNEGGTYALEENVLL